MSLSTSVDGALAPHHHSRSQTPAFRVNNVKSMIREEPVKGRHLLELKEAKAKAVSDVWNEFNTKCDVQIDLEKILINESNVQNISVSNLDTTLTEVFRDDHEAA